MQKEEGKMDGWKEGQVAASRVLVSGGGKHVREGGKTSLV